MRSITIPYNIQYLAYLVVVQLRQIVPFWLLGLLAGAYVLTYGGGGIQRLVSEVSKDNGLFWGLPAAALLGAISPITMYGMIPALAALLQHKVRQSIVTSFIITSILINPNVFIYSFALGTDIALLRMILCILAGVVGGMLVELLLRGKAVYKVDGFELAELEISQIRDTRRSLDKNFRRAAVRTAPNLALGVLLAALFQIYFPESAFENVFGRNNGLSVLFAASLGVPAYYCGGGTVPLIKAWMSEGMSAGSALAFMITGPATKFTNMTALKTIMPAKSFVLYMIYNTVFALVAGMSIDLIYSIL